ncbi:hypothetical protein J2W95_002400 [Flavobacterium granuli]|uniref:Transmembrane protein n=1 Tax=Flavobacterium granuli TaxID=280093 RepID=A0ABU1S661_9FLAO|nr:hypothetical protein [Flavobacterium granuli]
MRKNYPNFSINQFNQIAILETLIQGIFRRKLFFFIFYLRASIAILTQFNAGILLEIRIYLNGVNRIYKPSFVKSIIF